MFPRTYTGIAEAILKTALTPANARGIARKAGLVTSGSPAANLGLLLTANGGVPQETTGTTRVRYDRVEANGGDFTSSPGADEFVCIAGGLCRISATLAVEATLYDGLYGHGIETASGQVIPMERVLYNYPTVGLSPDRIVLTGSVSLAVLPGEVLRHVFYETFGNAGALLQEPESMRLYAEMMP